MGRHSAPDAGDSADTGDVVVDSADGSSATESSAPALRVVRGTPSPDELAVVAAVIAAAGRGSEPGPTREPVPPRNRWADPFDRHQRPWQHGVAGWRTSLR